MGKNHHQMMPFMRFLYSSKANMRDEFPSTNLLSLAQDVAAQSHRVPGDSILPVLPKSQRLGLFSCCFSLPGAGRPAFIIAGPFGSESPPCRQETCVKAGANQTAYQNQSSSFPALSPFPLMGFCLILLFFVLKSLGLLRR